MLITLPGLGSTIEFTGNWLVLVEKEQNEIKVRVHSRVMKRDMTV